MKCLFTSRTQVLVNDLTVHVGTSRHFSDLPTNQDLRQLHSVSD